MHVTVAPRVEMLVQRKTERARGIYALARIALQANQAACVY